MVFFDHFDCGERSGARSRVSSERSPQTADSGSVHHFRTPGDRSERQSTAQRFCGGDDVRLDAVMLDRKKLPGAADAGLYFVSDEKDPVFAANFLKDGVILLWRDDESAFAKNWLRDYGGHGFRCNNTFESVFERRSAGDFAARIGEPVRTTIAIGIWQAIDITGKRFETSFVRMCFAGQRECHQGASMKRVMERNNRRPLGICASNFDSVLDGFRSAVYQQSFLGEFAGRQRVHSFGDGDIAFVGSHAEAQM